MTYTIENIYKYYGRLDKVVTLSFAQDSDSYKAYPDCMTGIFQYTREEREELELKILDKNQLSSGFIKFNEVLNEVSESQKLILLQTGINSAEIIDIFHIEIKPSKNEFISKEIRKLPEPTILEMDFSNFNYDSFLIHFNNNRLFDGYKLTTEEEYEDIGARLRVNNIDIGSINDKSQIDIKTGKLKEPILYHYLLSKQRINTLTSEEKDSLTEIESIFSTEQSNIINGEIKKSLNNLKQLNAYKSQLGLISEQLSGFRSKRYTHGKFPVWIDIEGLAHILLRHVSETNIGEGFKNKSKFQYLIDDIHMLIKTVLQSIEIEIQKHFEINPNNPFKRHGKMSVYFKGDYYVVDIDKNGRLMTFYKRN